jgi:hypothetical protein
VVEVDVLLLRGGKEEKPSSKSGLNFSKRDFITSSYTSLLEHKNIVANRMTSSNVIPCKTITESNILIIKQHGLLF